MKAHFFYSKKVEHMTPYYEKQIQTAGRNILFSQRIQRNEI
jgi:hypothetical protein